ncbi:NTE family protein [Tistlia consotensis]|uniref:NTE family protein n=1 Tax=Tistlia consotensis USBA 355 TaxID=560819 RepID=A0A1Y6CAX8_9PROT|nr:patatin-like phospholipase family protein [Tistlia consotensis]SMF53992.1 NTE family protein [Tistlia consotensis USBA 355]SNR86355.1 NTE family protein [Tistlia consotensis]
MTTADHRTPTAEQKTINLALQGGGAHGAFIWGVLDRLLEERRLFFEGISATSAGAMNAAILAHGLTVGGRDGARQALHDFWASVAAAAAFSPIQRTPVEWLFSLAAPGFAYFWFDLATRTFSPYQFNPLNLNPLRDLLERTVDFERLRQDCALTLFVSATNVRSGKIRVFSEREVTADAVMASACLPFLFQAVEIEGEAYWDGGYMGNPAIFPLIYGCASRDVAIVHINPIQRDEVPTDAQAILNRVNEISFNSSLMREMRTIAFVSDLIDKGQLQGRPMKRMLIHSIDNDAALQDFTVASKMSPDWRFLTRLRDIGRKTAEDWLPRTWDKLGVESSVDIAERYL